MVKMSVYLAAVNLNMVFFHLLLDHATRLRFRLRTFLINKYGYLKQNYG